MLTVSKEKMVVSMVNKEGGTEDATILDSKRKLYTFAEKTKVRCQRMKRARAKAEKGGL